MLLLFSVFQLNLFFLNWLVVLNHFSVATGNAHCFVSNDSELVQMEYVCA